MAKDTNKKGRFVGIADDFKTALRIDRELAIVTHFNQFTLPVLKQCGFFKGGPITDYLVDMTSDDRRGPSADQLFEGYFDKHVEALKKASGYVPLTGYQLDNERWRARQTFDEEILFHYEETPREGLSDTALRYIRFCPKNKYYSNVDGGEYEMDNEAYLAEACQIYAETPAEEKALDVLQKAASILNALKVPEGFKLEAFFEANEAGRYAIKKEINIDAWRQLVKSNS